jgi:HEAT repeat protein
MPFVEKQSSAPVAEEERNRGRELPDLLAQLEAEDPTARRWAARDLASYPQAVPDLLRCLTHEAESAVREMILTSLIRMKDVRAVAGLAECLRGENVSLRNAAREAIRQFPQDAPEVVQPLLCDADADVRIFAINVLQTIPHPHVEDWLLGVLAREGHVNVCAAAVEALVDVGTAKALDPLVRLKLQFVEEPYLQFAIDLALNRIGEI